MIKISRPVLVAIKRIVFGICFLIILVLAVILFYKARINQFLPICPVFEKEEIVNGNSLSGLVENGEGVKSLYGYYQCHEIQREDVVIYQYAGSSNNLIKIVKGIPGDDFHLEKTTGGWNILINGKIVENSLSQPYLVGEAGYQMLFLYEKGYKGKIPEKAYLLLGNLAGGSMDSSHFGLVGKSNILAKVEL